MNAIFNILKQAAPYLDSIKQKLIHVSFLAAFTLVFLSVYNPFNMTAWYGSSIFGYIFVASSFFLISQFLLRNLFGFRTFRLFEFIIWAIFELLAASFFIYLIFGPTFPTIENKLAEYFTTFRYFFLIVAGPYALSIWYLANKQKVPIEDPLLTNILSPSKKNELLSIKNDSNSVVFAINYDQILYIQSSGNYLDIYYLKGEKPTKELVRMSLRELESQITNSFIIKIHRSYLVNKNKISSIKKIKKGYKLNVSSLTVELPVSAGFKEAFEVALELESTI